MESSIPRASLKMDSKPFTPKNKPKKSLRPVASAETIEAFVKTEVHLTPVKLIYSQNYLSLFKDKNKNLPEGIKSGTFSGIFKVCVTPQEDCKKNMERRLPSELYVPRTSHSPEIVDEDKREKARDKQISFGKMTTEYVNYINIIPKNKRRITDPETPNVGMKASKRRWDQVVRRWRRALHAFDDVHEENQVELARALAMRLENEHDPKRTAYLFRDSTNLVRDE
ncbi:hypothetical protein EIN_372080 [Entamoeba invadens IP1]|uniref:Histone RNA hairpin-binding protein RNA-binding domain-containing protein n=1 Tax=Entamoeba invadens IP1 TaxID=370355 RepID=A0A0A1UC22_ENTIV|nr:hypothetical protein EIN_372080 [Entamoeba invadens IP1]ELP92786.1 hypothetical protein EIN_372080 [Entamoeba invadens IP1]|eukprot:XP_004259557.1 hypothetical protein EIN_372080 [Entamoeba invadens IP1]